MLYTIKERVAKKIGCMNDSESIYTTGLYRRAFFLFSKMPFELNLVPTETVTGQYISLLVTRRHFFKTNRGKMGRGDNKLFFRPTTLPPF